ECAGDGALLRAGALGDLRGAQPDECQLLERSRAVAFAHVPAVVVLGQLLDDAPCLVLAAADDLDRDGRSLCLHGGERAALTVENDQSPALGTAGTDGLQDTVLLDGADELRGE